MTRLADRIEQMQASVTVALNDKIVKMREMGEDIIPFNAGEPDFDTPKVIVKACKQAMDSGKTHYIGTAGITPLRKVVAKKLKEENGIDCTADEIVITVGAKQALYNSVMALCNPGDEVIIPTPCWVSYVEMVKLAQAKPVFVKTKDNYHLDIEAISQEITEHTKMIIINTPNNPTGAVYDRDELKKLGELAIESGFYIVSDEVYEKLVYGEAKMVSIASLSSEIKERTITINGFSKGYAMTGWRIGYLAAPTDIAKGIVRFQGHTTYHGTTFVQYASVKALMDCKNEVKSMLKAFADRRDVLLELLSEIPGIQCEEPQGAFYVLADISAYFGKTYNGTKIDNTLAFAEYLLAEAAVAVVPGIAFESPNTIRIAYSTSEEIIREGIRRIKIALENLK